MPSFCIALLTLLATEIPALTGRVVDQAGLLSAEQRLALEQRLEQEERESSVQIVIAVISSLEGEPLEDFSMRLAEAWRIGQEGLDNGAIVLVVLDERAVRIEVGYGLEPVIPDGLAGRIIRERIAPRFREGNFYGGLSGAVDGLILAARREYPAQPRVPPNAWVRNLPRLMGASLGVAIGWFIAFGILWDTANLRHWLTPALVTAFFFPVWIHFGGWLTASNALFFAAIGFVLGALLSRFGRLMDKVTYGEGGSRASWSSGSSRSTSYRTSSSSSSSRSRSSFSGGGGRFGGGGASGRW